MAAKYEEIQTKSVLNKHNYISPWGWGRYTAHAYIGCEHACEYCYERFDKYAQFQDPDDYTRIIKVKTNAPEVLARQLSRVKRDVIALDRYQPAEMKYGLNRKMLAVIRDQNFPCFILEKSDILLRDLDILLEISRNTGCNVAYSISILEDRLVKIFEPGAPHPAKRLAAVKKLAEAGIMAGVFLLPVIPYIGDDEETLDKTIEKIKMSGAAYVLVGSLTLSPNHRDRFMKLLREFFPGVLEKYEKLYGRGISPAGTYLMNFARKASRLCKKHGIPDFVPRRFVPEDMPVKNFEISTMLFHISHLLEGKGESPYRSQAYNKAGQSIEAMTENIEIISKLEKIGDIPYVGKKIGEMIYEKLGSGKCSFYEKLNPFKGGKK